MAGAVAASSDWRDAPPPRAQPADVVRRMLTTKPLKDGLSTAIELELPAPCHPTERPIGRRRYGSVPLLAGRDTTLRMVPGWSTATPAGAVAPMNMGSGNGPETGAVPS